MSALSPRQQAVLSFIVDFIPENGYAPSIKEICAGVGLTSLASVHKHLVALEAKGRIRRRWNHSRSIELVGLACPYCGHDMENP